ncbi:MAG: alpha/beta hydrolase [Bdellovibrionales bacterium]|nr:alpha/beta hydrolase [Bdellovibrionales bacterium]
MKYIIFMTLLAVGCTHSSLKYDAELSQVNYPFQVQSYNFTSQNQNLTMRYMYLKKPENKKNIVLLHGKNFSGAYWETTALWLFENGYNVVMPDQIGFGKSTKPKNYQYSFAALANNTFDLLKQLDIKNYIVVGHSMGGMLASRMALLKPKSIDKLVLINPIGLEDYLKYVEYKDVSFFYQNELNKTPEKVKDYQKKYYYDGKWHSRYDPWVKMHKGWIQGPDWKLVAWNNALTFDMVFTQPVVNEFAHLKVPTRLILGTRDRTGPGRGWKKPNVSYKLGQYQDLGDKAVKLLPKAKLYKINNIGHMPHIENFELFITNFKKALKE